MIRRYYQHRINVIAIEYLAEIVVRRAFLVAVRRIDRVLCPDSVLRIDVTDSDNAQVFTGKKTF